jgi:Flp pilus assembly protein TadD
VTRKTENRERKLEGWKVRSARGKVKHSLQDVYCRSRRVRTFSKISNTHGLIGATLLLVCSSRAAAQPTPTFAHDVARILYAHCASCHQTDGDAPFSLVTYADAKSHARQIADVTIRRYMPPWKPDASEHFVGERRLSDHDINVLQAWAKAGAPEGDGAITSPPPSNTSRWRNGEPDLIVTLPPYELAADGADVFRNFVVTVPGHETRYVRTWQFRPGNPAVHHANIRIDATPASRRLDEADPAPGYEGVILHSADYPDGHFLGWTPGQAPPGGSSELAWALRGGTDLVVQMHMRPTGRTERVAPSIGFYFSDGPPSKTPTIVRLGRQNLDIPAGVSSSQVTDTFTLPVEAQVVAIQPHAHYRARTVRAWASLPGTSERQLIAIRDWDFNWQDQYRVAEPFWLPAGTTLHMEYTFDNSNANPRNPDHPASRVSWGWRSSDEMADVWIQLMTRSDRERETLDRITRRKMAAEDAIGSEVLIARQPDYATLRNDAALIYMELGQPAKALEHFAAVTRLQPTVAAAWYNEGVAFEQLGRFIEARDRYVEATRLDPSYSAAHNNLANILSREGNLRDAASHYEIAVTADPSNAEAHCAFARALTEAGNPQRAIAEYRTAIATRPDWAPCLINFSWLLSAHADPGIRQPAEAVRLAERSVALTDRHDPGALDALAAAYAAAGRFNEAVQAGLAAETLATQGGLRDAAQQIRARVDLYRQARAFIIP